MRYKTGLLIVGCLSVVGGGLWMRYHTENHHKPLLQSEKDSHPETAEPAPSATLLSNEAEYPVPVIQLQKELTHDLMMETTPDFPAVNPDSEHSDRVGADSGEKLQNLRRRLSELQALNKQ